MGIFKSAYYFLWGILKRFYIWLYALFLDPFDLYQKHINPILQAKYGVQIDMPSNLGLIAFILLILLAAIMTYHEERKKNIRPKLKINHKLRGNNYYCESFTWLPDELRKMSGEELYRTAHDLHRISVTNLSTTQTAEDVEVAITKIEPPRFRLTNNLPIKLHFMGNNEKPFDKYRNINPKTPIFLDVIQWGSHTGSDYNFEILNSEDKDIKFKFNENEECILTITASGRDIKLATNRFKINYTNKVGEKLKLSFRQIN